MPHAAPNHSGRPIHMDCWRQDVYPLAPDQVRGVAELSEEHKLQLLEAWPVQ